jgi:histone H3/H4
MGKSLAVKSAVKALVGKNMRVAGDLWKGLDERIMWKVKRAVERAKANGRKTVRACDL